MARLKMVPHTRFGGGGRRLTGWALLGRASSSGGYVGTAEGNGLALGTTAVHTAELSGAAHVAEDVG